MLISEEYLWIYTIPELQDNRDVAAFQSGELCICHSCHADLGWWFEAGRALSLAQGASPDLAHHVSGLQFFGLKIPDDTDSSPAATIGIGEKFDTAATPDLLQMQYCSELNIYLVFRTGLYMHICYEIHLRQQRTHA